MDVNGDATAGEFYPERTDWVQVIILTLPANAVCAVTGSEV